MQIALSTLSDVTSASASVSLDGAAIATRVTTDSRDVKPGDIFVALRGERFDGHRFVETAIEQGAIVAIVDTLVESSQPLPQLVVEDTLAAYQAIARWWRDELGTTVIGITGSVGKTTTKELLAGVLGRHGTVLKTQKNYNNEIGVPKTLLDLTPEHDYAVVEMAMRGKGQIAELARIAKPDVGVIVNVGTAHIGLLGSREAIAQAKCELLAELPETSVAILNADNALLMETAATVWSGRQISYGFDAGDRCGTLDGETLHLADPGGDRAFPLPLPGRHNASNYLAAIAVAESLGLDTAGLADGLSIALPDGRAKRIELPDDVVLLDETYNAGLESMLAAIDLLAETPGKRRLAVLGTMKELGDRAVEFHQKVGEALAKRAAAGEFDGLFVVAEPELAAALSEAFAATSMPCVTETEETDAARSRVTEKLLAMLQPGDRVLLKASHSVALDRVVAVLCDRLAVSPSR
ncbi:MAG: UDP-N-acetylmuramoyl-tripeptide--D-alanyl-D-alanine ligase [Geitlerinemataceae cyanobacterium]